MAIAEEQLTGTKKSLVDAAATLIAERGFDAVTVREITGRADTNIASVKYHFGSKEELIDAVVANFVLPVNLGRLARIDKLEEVGDFCAEDLLRAFLEPMLSQIKGSPLSEKLFCQLMGRVISERPYEFPEKVMGQFREVAARYVPAFIKAEPGLTEEDVFWRIHFSFGVMSNMLTNGELLKKVASGKVGEEQLEKTLSRVIDFCAAGFKQGGTKR